MNNEDYIKQIKKNAKTVTNNNVNWETYKRENIRTMTEDKTNKQGE